MTKENKKLLLKDLCARLPHGVKVNYVDETYDVFGCSGNSLIIVLPFLSNLEAHPIEICKPYLRPMSSITEEEKEEIKPLFSKFTDEFGKRVLVVRQNKMTLYQDWLNAHHFDYRGLIEKGLALEAPEGMYDFK